MAAPLLAGREVVIFRSEDNAAALRASLEAHGAVVSAHPAIRQVAAASDDEIAAILEHRERYDWIAFTSANAVRFFAAACRRRGAGPETWQGTPVAVVGKATASAAAAVGFTPRWVASGSGAALAARLAAEPGGTERRVLLPGSRLARAGTRAALEAAGIAVEAVVVYDTLPVDASELLPFRAACERGALPDACVFASPSAVSAVLAILGERGRGWLSSPRVQLVAIGPTTAAALCDAGLPVAAEAAAPTAEGLVEGVVAAVGARRGGRRVGREEEEMLTTETRRHGDQGGRKRKKKTRTKPRKKQTTKKKGKAVQHLKRRRPNR